MGVAGQSFVLSIFSNLFLPYFLTQGLSLKPELTDQLDCLDGKALGLRASPSQWWDHRDALLPWAVLCVRG